MTDKPYKTWIELMNRKLTLREKIYYPICRFFNKLRYLYKDIYWFAQHHTRGYSDSDIWNVGDFLGEHILKCLKAYRSCGINGIPCIIDDNGEQFTYDTWLAMVDRIIDGWEFILNADDIITWEFEENKLVDVKYHRCAMRYGIDVSKPVEYKECYKLYPLAEADAMLFVKYLHVLWD